jgi:hypothetical protein
VKYSIAAKTADMVLVSNAAKKAKREQKEGLIQDQKILCHVGEWKNQVVLERFVKPSPRKLKKKQTVSGSKSNLNEDKKEYTKKQEIIIHFCCN